MLSLCLVTWPKLQKSHNISGLQLHELLLLLGYVIFLVFQPGVIRYFGETILYAHISFKSLHLGL